MVDGGMMLGKVVCIVVYSWLPVEFELFLCCPVSQPEIPHVPRLGSFLMDVVVYKTSGCRVVRLKWGWRLRMVKSC